MERKEYDLSGGKPDTASTTEKARDWFASLWSVVEIIRFAPIAIGEYEFTAQIRYGNDEKTVKRHDGWVIVAGYDRNGTPQYTMELDL